MARRLPHLVLVLVLAAATAFPDMPRKLSDVIVVGKRPVRDVPERDAEFSGERLAIEASRPTSLPQLLRRSPGVLVRQAGGEESPPDYLIRGLDPIEHRYFLEGVPLTDGAFNAASPAGWMPTEALGAVDLYAEGVPVFLGDDGLGGAVHFRLPTECRGGGFGSRVGSFGYFRVFGDPCVGPARFAVSYAQSREDFSYFDDNGTPLVPGDDRIVSRGHNGFRRVTLLPQIALGRGLTAFGLGSYVDKEVPGPSSSTAAGTLRQGYALAALKGETKLGEETEVEGHLYARYHAERYAPVPGSARSLSPNRASGGEVGTRGRLRWKRFLGAGWEAMAGVTWETFDADAVLALGPGGPKDRLQVPLGLSAEWRAGPVSLRPAVLAHGYRYSRATGGERAFALASPRLGARWEIAPRLQLRAAVGAYYRAPTLAELYGSPSGIAPNEQLAVERATKAELGADWELRRPTSWLRAVRLSYTFSVSRARDLVSYVPSSPTTRTAVNVGEARILAHEFAAEARSRWDVNVRAMLSLFETTNLTDAIAYYGKELPQRPPYRALLSGGYEGERWGLGYEAVLTGPLFWDPANQKRMDAVVEHGVRAYWDTRAIGVISLEALNLGDVTTAVSAQVGFNSLDNSAGYPGFPAPGRRWYLTWKYAL